jgi:hypothetical protein
MFDYVFLCPTMRVSMCNSVLLCADICDNVLLSAAMSEYLELCLTMCYSV